MKKLSLFIMGMVCLYLPLSSSAQTDEKINALTIGDTVPNFTFRHLLRYKDSTAKLSDFNGRLVILDFFLTTCSGCIAVLPKYDSLQRYFGKSIKIIPTSTESPSKVNRFLRKSKIGNQLRSLSFATGDSLLAKRFPHQFIPHEVWITGQGTVKAITSWQYITKENIEKVLTHKPLHWLIKDDRRDYNLAKRILTVNRNNVDNNIQSYYSTLSGYITNAFPNSVWDTSYATHSQKVSMINFPIINLYLLAFDHTSLATSHIILKTKDTARFIYNPERQYRDVWNRKNRYSYEAIFPLDIPEDEIRNKIISDLDFYFNLNTQLKSQEIKCLVLVKNKDDESAIGQANTKTPPTSVGNLLWYWNNHHYGQPLLKGDNVNNKRLLCLDPTPNVDSLRKGLKVLGFDLNQRKEKLIVLTIREKTR